MLAAWHLANRTMRDYSSKFSRHDFTLPQLFACLAVKEHLRKSYRQIEALLNDSPHWCRALGMQRVPDHNTLCRAANRLLQTGRVSRLLDKLVRWAVKGRMLRLSTQPLAIDSSMYESRHVSRHYERRKARTSSTTERKSRRKQTVQGLPKLALPVIGQILSQGASPDAVACFRGIHKLAELCQAAREVWDKIDLLLLPTAGTIYRIDQISGDPIELNKNLGYYTTFANLMDLCAVAVPAGFEKDGLPASVSLIAPAGRDGYLVEVAQRLHRSAELTLGATGRPMPAAAPAPAAKSDHVLLAVVGAHLSGQPLNGQLTRRRAKLVRACRTWPCYRLYALAGTTPPKPGLVNVQDGGAAIEVEVWELDAQSFGSFVCEVPSPMVIGTVRLEDGSLVKGFLCEPFAINGSADITSHGGWRSYIAKR